MLPAPIEIPIALHTKLTPQTVRPPISVGIAVKIVQTRKLGHSAPSWIFDKNAIGVVVGSDRRKWKILWQLDDNQAECIHVSEDLYVHVAR